LVGLGVGARQLLPALSTSGHGRLVAVADVRSAALEQAEHDFGVRTYASIEELSRDAEVEVVWVATPNHLHAQHAVAAADAGKHVIVSKPMAISLAETAAMNAAARRNGVQLLAGHTQSMAPTVRKMAALVASGELGKLGMLHTWHYTDWMYRPRLPVELDVSQGGGPVFRQASHQVDIVRSIAGKQVRSVRAMVVQLDADRGAPGAYTVYLEFEDGTPATIVYSGYGHFSMGELLGRDVAAPSPRPSPTGTGGADEATRKEALRNAMGGGNSLGLFGLTIVTCERGDLRESHDGLFVYQRGQRTEVKVQDELRGEAELRELHDAVRHGRPLVHDGRWGESTLEVCLSIHESARTQSEVLLRQ
jgi:phthalate 4,5-cis-dihydrodiol dehydrogenase